MFKQRRERGYAKRKARVGRQEAARVAERDEQHRRAGDYRYEYGGPRKGWIRKPGKGGR